MLGTGSRLADLVHDVASEDGLALAPGDVRSWNNLMLRQSSRTLVLSGEMSRFVDPCFQYMQDTLQQEIF